MQVKWSKLLAKTSIWLCTEVALNGVGLGDLANYSEFMRHSRMGLQWSTELISLVINV
jgi:hypothetical protein